MNDNVCLTIFPSKNSSIKLLKATLIFSLYVVTLLMHFERIDHMLPQT